jgi:hypothetical protein
MPTGEKVQKSKLDTYIGEFYNFSGKVSDITRNLAFAGIGLVWIFKNGTIKNLIQVPSQLLFPLIFFISCLCLDFCHYIFKTIALFIFYKKLENKLNKGKIDEDYIEKSEYPQYIETCSWIIWVLKILCIIIAYIFIFSYVLKDPELQIKLNNLNPF